MLKNLLYIALLLFLPVISLGQRTYDIKKLDGDIQLDGFMDEPVWGQTEETCDFTISYPNFGESSCYNSYVRLFYTDEAIYVGGILMDDQPDSVSYSLSQRDDVGNADWFGITIDPYATNVTSFAFIVTAAGVESDAIEYTSGPDFSWNAVWRSAVVARDHGWSFEMRIPFSAIRFPNKDVQNWHFNMARQVRRNREESYWNPVNPAVYGQITQSGKIEGVKDVRSPLRLSLTPYLTGYLENSYDSDLNKQTWKRRLRGGMDLKYGINDAFTLDMTLIPDFGQTTSDRKVLNLGPFEVQYAERRPFFIEGIDLFRTAGVFYSRRIGGTPYNYYSAYSQAKDGEEVVSNPETAPLINASKFSGRNTNGLGIGVFNAVEGNTYAIISDSSGNQRQVQTNPLTNYNIFVLSQNLKNNSVVSFINTNVIRQGDARDANVSALDATLFSNDGKYKIDLLGSFSSVFQGTEPVSGHRFSSSFSKVSGNNGYTFSYSEMSDTYDPNDLGFIYNNNGRSYAGTYRMNDYSAGNHFLRKWGSVGVVYSELYKPQQYSSFNINWNVAGTMRNFLTCGLNGGFTPFGSVNHFESRVFGREVLFGPNYRIGGFYSSDYSKVLALDMRFSWQDYVDSKQKNYNFNISPRYRASDRLFLVWNSSFQWLEKDYGYVSVQDAAYADNIMLGVRDRQIIENRLNLDFIFTKRMGLTLVLRHYWQQVEYVGFRELYDEGLTIDSEYNPISEYGYSSHNTNYNAFTLDINYRWVFIPGSELRIVYKNNIFHSKSLLENTYFETFNTLFDQPQINSISMKFLIYLDAIYLRNIKARDRSNS